MCENLEERRMLAAGIVWVNKDDPNNNLALWGQNADTAKKEIQAVIDAWNRVITNFNYQSIDPKTGQIRTEFELSIKVDKDGNLDPTVEGQGDPNGMVDQYGKPWGSTLTLNRGTATGNGLYGGGWFFDSTPNDSEEFLGQPANAFGVTGDLTGWDLYTLVAHEMGHGLGLNAYPQLNINKGFEQPTGQPDPKAGHLWMFKGATIRHLMTTNNKVPDENAPNHTAEADAIYTDSQNTVWKGSVNLMNADVAGGRFVPDFVTATILKDAYGYTIADPASLGTMYAMVLPSKQLLIRGGPAASNDTIKLSYLGTKITVSVDVKDPPGSGVNPGDYDLPAFVSTFDTSITPINSIRIEGYDGNDEIDLINVPQNAPVTINAGAGDDHIALGQPGDDLDEIHSPVTVNGGDGSDILELRDEDDIYDDSYTITATTVDRPFMSTVTRGNDVERLQVEGGSGGNTFDVNSLAFSDPGGGALPVAGLYLYGNDGDDTFTGTGLDTWASQQIAKGEAIFDIDGGNGADSLSLDDSSNVEFNTFNLTSTSIVRTASSRPSSRPLNIAFPNVESFSYKMGSGNDTLNVRDTAPASSYHFDMGDGNDSLYLGASNAFSGNPLDSLAATAAFSVSAGAGSSDYVKFDDGFSTVSQPIYTLGNSTFTRAGIGTINFDGFEQEILNGAKANGTYNITGVPTSASARILAGVGDDTFNVGLNNSLDPMNGNLDVDGYTGNDTVNFNGQNDTGAVTHTLNDSSYSNIFTGPITYERMENLNINSGAGADTFNVTPSATTTYFLSAGNPLPPTTLGDRLIINIAGLTAATNFPNGIGAGTYTFTGRNSVYYSGMEVVTTTGVLLPAITSLTDFPDPIGVGAILTLTANGVTGGGQTVSKVSFYQESNNTPGLQIGSDLFLTSDSNGSDGWAAFYNTSGLIAGQTYTFYAVATNAANLVSDPVSTTTTAQLAVNQAPTLGSITDSPDPNALDADLSLQIYNSLDPDGSIASVAVYRESNNTPGLQTGAGGDQSLGNAFGGPVNWGITVSTNGLPVGTYTYYAQAVDDKGAKSNVVSTTNTIANITAPRVGSANFLTNNSPHVIGLVFTEDVGNTLTLSDATLLNTTTNTTLPLAKLDYSPLNLGGQVLGIANFTLPPHEPDGNYRFTISANAVHDSSNHTMLADFVMNFSWLNGDADGDHKVGFTDLVRVAQNYGFQGAVYSQGDFNYDGNVSFPDLVTVAQQYGKSLTPVAGAAPVTSDESQASLNTAAPIKATAAIRAAFAPPSKPAAATPPARNTSPFATERITGAASVFGKKKTTLLGKKQVSVLES